MKKVLIVEKECFSRELLLHVFKRKKLQLFTVEDEIRAFELLKQHSFDLVLTDLNGISALNRAPSRSLEVPIVHLSEENDPPLKGIDYVLKKPFSEKEATTLLFHLLEKGRSRKKMIAQSPQMKQLLKEVEKIAKSHSNVFIFGESGTGKEVVANLIHTHSKRTIYPFIRVNCAAIPDTLIESEFFGHEKGAFTGAFQTHIGRFERADKGTLLLDEVSEIPPFLQAKLLRVIQEQEFERVGGTQAIHVDVRFISTSNREIKQAIADKTFRSDLYYRLNVIPIYLPPLRDRKEDILPLADHFLSEICAKNEVTKKTFSKEAQEKLLDYPWPGNIRELRNVIEHGVVMDDASVIEKSHLLIYSPKEKEETLFPIITIKEVEKAHILRVLESCGGNRNKAAHLLGISVRTLRNKLKDYFQEKK